jgi:hypothetical protein
MKKAEPDKFEMTLTSGDKEYFLHGGPKGLVVGPKTPGRDDHLTFGGDDDFAQVHRTINDREDWRVTSEVVEAELDSFIANNAAFIDHSVLSLPGTYVVSLRRVQVLYSTFMGLVSVPMHLLFPLFVTTRKVKTAKGTEFSAAVDSRRLAHFASSAEPVLQKLFRVFGPALARILPTIIMRVGKSMLLKPGNGMLTGEGLAFIMSDSRVGIVWENGGRIAYVPITAIIQMVERIERNQPFGKLSELNGPLNGSLKITGILSGSQ